jgi:hypothetical protein
VALALTQAAAAAGELRLLIDGSPAVAYRGECLLIDAGGRESTARFTGIAPETYRLDGVAASCSLHMTDLRGRVRGVLLDGGQGVAQGEVGMPFHPVTLRSAGPWGGAAATSRYPTLAPLKPAKPRP